MNHLLEVPSLTDGQSALIITTILVVLGVGVGASWAITVIRKENKEQVILHNKRMMRIRELSKIIRETPMPYEQRIKNSEELFALIDQVFKTK